jgi:hypothetical protein
MTTIAVAATATPGVVAPFQFRAPLTERILARLPGPRLLWMLAWGLSPFAAYEIAYRFWNLPTYAGLESNGTIALVNLVGLWAAGRLAQRIDRVQPTLERLLEPQDLGPRRHPFRHVGSVGGPLAISAIFVLGWDFLDFLRFPGFANGFTVVTIFLGLVPLSCFVWVYGVGLLGLDRIGRRSLRLQPFATDPHLGLKPLGSLAFEAFLLCGLGVTPALLWLLTDVRSTVETLAFVAVFSGLFVLSAYTLHRQLVAAKAAHVGWARQLVAAALGPIDREEPDPTDIKAVTAALERVRPGLAAASEIERRALAIAEWPFDATIIRAVAAIVTSVTAVVIARLLLSRLGM